MIYVILNSFQVYIAEMHGEAQECAEKNIHDWTQDKIQKVNISSQECSYLIACLAKQNFSK